MLVLTRNSGESVLIGDDIKITVLNTISSQIRLAIEAPTHVPVHREEVYQQIKQKHK